jgi:hypothetical protein
MPKASKYVKALVYAYQDPVPLVNFDYRVCSWYREGKVVESNYDHVIAYKDGYKCRFKIQVYKFRNVAYRETDINKLKYRLQSRPDKYRGWLHHMNLYAMNSGNKGGYMAQIKFS